MIKYETYTIDAPIDFELHIKREHKLTYHIAYNSNTDCLSGIVFMIPGFGEDADISYQKNLLEYTAKEHNVIAVFVEYHCIFNRTENGAELALSPLDTELLLEKISRYNIKLDENHLDLNSISFAVNHTIQKLKENDKVSSDYREPIAVTLVPKKGEYQNFGLLQALDIITVLYDLLKIGFDKIVNEKPIIAFGSSHGGYIANLLVKIAPNTFDLIVDNSCYAIPELKYFLGKQHDHDSNEIKYAYLGYDNIVHYATSLSFWSLNENSPNYFSPSHYEMRILGIKPYIEKLSNIYKTETQIISYHSIHDDIALYHEKANYFQLLEECKINCKLYTIKDECDIDGKFIKNLNHAMSMSNKELINRTLPNHLDSKKNKQTNLSLLSNISYTTSLGDIYQFKFEKDHVEAAFIKKGC